MTTLEFMEKQLEKHRKGLERELNRGVPDEVIRNIKEKIYHYEMVISKFLEGKCDASTISKLTQEDKNVILAFAENDMTDSKTARDLSYHRNTIKYHIIKVEEKTGLNPRKFYDLIKLVSLIKEGDSN